MGTSSNFEINARAVHGLLTRHGLKGGWELSNGDTVITSAETGVRVVYQAGRIWVRIEWVDVDMACTRQSLTMPIGSTFGAVRAVAEALDALIRECGDGDSDEVGL